MAIITLLLSCAILLYKHLSGDATIIFHSYFFRFEKYDLVVLLSSNIHVSYKKTEACNRANCMLCRL